MTQEEKAKAYDEAIKRAEATIKVAQNQKEVYGCITTIFPELKEPDDMEIRKAILNYLTKMCGNSQDDVCGVHVEDAIAWLEKQGEQELVNFDEAEKEKANFVSDGFIECHADFLDFKEGNTYWLEYIGDDKYNVRSDNLLGKTYHITPCQLYTVFKKLTWLEKQGKCHISHDDEIMIGQLIEYFTTGHGLQNTNETVVAWLNDVKEKIEKQGEQKCLVEMKTPEESLGIDSETYNEIVDECIYGEQKPNYTTLVETGNGGINALVTRELPTNGCDEQKTADKVEPKFKVGDWVVYYRNDSSREVLQVYDIRDGRYYFTDNVHFSWSVKECDEKSHLWTIQDAKDGDVLVNDTILIIVDHLGTFENRPIIYSWYFTDSQKFYEMGTSEPDRWEVKGFTPATKEQRDILFKKMHEAGYEWLEETKELTKFHVIDEGKDEMDYCFTKMMNGEKVSSALGEEDERIIKEIDEIIYECPYCESKEEISNWLKSLKQRIGG